MQRFRRKEQIEAAPYEGESILFNPETKQFVKLNRTTALIWDRLNGGATTDELVREVSDRFSNVEEDQAATDIEEILNEMVHLGLVEKNESATEG